MVDRSWKYAFLLFLSILIIRHAETICSQQLMKSNEKNPFTSSLGSYNYFLAHNYIHDGNIQILIECCSVKIHSEISFQVTQWGGTILGWFEQLKMLSVKIPYACLQELNSREIPIFLDNQVRACLDSSVPIIKPALAWSAVEGYFGKTEIEDWD